MNFKKIATENFSYLKDVLGVRYINRERITVNAVIDAAEASSANIAHAMPVAELVSFGSLAQLEENLKGCTRCKLSVGRLNIVFGYGSPKAEIMFIGEGPGDDEDREGLPFVGRAGDLLNKMISAMGLTHQEVYVANMVKCRVPEGRKPETEEIGECSPFLKHQIDLVNPKVIVALGNFAAQNLLQSESRISELRGRVMNWNGRKLICTYHPAYLLKTPSKKKYVWADLQMAMKEVGLEAPAKH